MLGSKNLRFQQIQHPVVPGLSLSTIMMMWMRCVMIACSFVAKDHDMARLQMRDGCHLHCFDLSGCWRVVIFSGLSVQVKEYTTRMMIVVDCTHIAVEVLGEDRKHKEYLIYCCNQRPEASNPFQSLTWLDCLRLMSAISCPQDG